MEQFKTQYHAHFKSRFFKNIFPIVQNLVYKNTDFYVPVPFLSFILEMEQKKRNILIILKPAKNKVSYLNNRT